MRTRNILTALGLAGALALAAGPAQAHSSVSFGINVSGGHHHPHDPAYYHGGHRWPAWRGHYPYRPYYYGPRAGYWPYAPPPPAVFADDCRWYRSRWHCY